jgi:hypothetical protein
MCIEDDVRSGRPKETVSDENIKKIHKIILNDRKVKLIQKAETLKISKEGVGLLCMNIWTCVLIIRSNF